MEIVSNEVAWGVLLMLDTNFKFKSLQLLLIPDLEHTSVDSGGHSRRFLKVKR